MARAAGVSGRIAERPAPITDASAGGAADVVSPLINRARAAQRELEAGGQEVADRAALAAAWALLKPENNRRLAEMAVETTGLGNVADKIAKNRRKTLGLLRDMRGQRTFGIVREDAAAGITEALRPVGVVAAITPSTNPVATPANNIINAVKSGNAVIVAPSPKGAAVCRALLALVHAEFARAKLPLTNAADLAQMIPATAREMTAELSRQADIAVVTGSQKNVRAAAACGTPSLAVGVGNVAVIVDETADLPAAARKIAASKAFDNATSCSSENSVIVVGAVADAFFAELRKAGGLPLDAADKRRLRRCLWTEGGGLNRDLVAKDAATLLAAVNRVRAAEGETPIAADGATFLIVDEDQVGAEHPFSGEKMSPVLTAYRAANFAAAVDRADSLLNHQGRGHSVGVHTNDDERPKTLALRLPACRVIVNQAHCFATGGAFDNGLPFSLSMGCGAWGGNTFSDNFNFRHLSHRVVISRPIPPREASEEELFADYWRAVGE